MKRITLVVGILLLAVTVFGQNVIVPKEVGKKHVLNTQLGKSPVDTLMLDEFFADQPQIIGYLGGGYVFGVNVEGSKKCAQGYLNFDPTLVIEEILMWVGGLDTVNGGSSLTITVNAIDDSSHYGDGVNNYDIACPGTVLATVNVPWANIDSGLSFATGVTHAPLSPLALAGDFCVVANYTNFYTHQDTIGFVCSYDGGASTNYGVEYTWWLYPAGTPFWTQYSHVFANGDNLIAFFPVSSDQIGIVENDHFVNGVKLSQNYPNPAPDGYTTINYALESGSDVTLNVFDYNGRMIESFNQGFQPAGQYCVSLSEKLASGIYYYSLTGCGTRLTKKMIIY